MNQYDRERSVVSRINRVEIIDETGRRLVLWNNQPPFEAVIQDDGRTLKVFVRGVAQPMNTFEVSAVPAP